MHRILFAGLLLIASPAMAIDFNQTIKTFDGKEFVDQEGKAAPQRLGTIVENSLLASADNEIERAKRFWLAEKIHRAPKDPELSPDEIVLIKKALIVQPLPVWGQAIRLIDPTFKPQ